MPHSPCWIIVLQFVGGHDDDSFDYVRDYLWDDEEEEDNADSIQVRHELQAPNPLTMGDDDDVDVTEDDDQ